MVSELHCPARLVLCEDPDSPAARAAIQAERVARVIGAVAGAPVQPGLPETLADPRLTEVDAVPAVLDELVDLHRGECVVVCLPGPVLAELDPTVTRSGEDRTIDVVS